MNGNLPPGAQDDPRAPWNQSDDYKIDIEDITWAELKNVEIEDVDPKDYPDFCDAFISYAEVNGVELDEDDLDYLTDKFSCEVNELAFESLIK